jgi:elongation factor 1-gamma
MALKIYSYPQNSRVFKAQIAGKYAGVPIETPAFKFPEDLHTPAFLAKNPLAKVPVLETPEGSIFESNAIMRYVGRKDTRTYGLYGSNAYEAGLVDQWIDFSVNEVELPLNVWVFPILGWMEFNHEATEKAKQDVQKALNILNQHFLTHTYLVGNFITLADIALAMVLLRGFTNVFDNKFRKPYGNVVRWFTTCVHQPQWAEVIGAVELCKEMKVAKPSEKKPEPAKPAAEKKPAKPAKDEDAGEEEDEAPVKKPNPLDLLPASKINLEEWKRYYSNSDDTRGDALPWLWSRLDDGYSFWFGDYKYNNDLEKLLNTSNLCGGFVQRLDKVRKYGFAAIVIFGEEPSLQIACCFMTRGQEFLPELSQVDDSENYEWRKADVTNAGDKELIADFFSWGGNFAGKYKPLNSARAFK